MKTQILSITATWVWLIKVQEEKNNTDHTLQYSTLWSLGLIRLKIDNNSPHHLDLSDLKLITILHITWTYQTWNWWLASSPTRPDVVDQTPVCVVPSCETSCFPRWRNSCHSRGSCTAGVSGGQRCSDATLVCWRCFRGRFYRRLHSWLWLFLESGERIKAGKGVSVLEKCERFNVRVLCCLEIIRDKDSLGKLQ